jgi:hypothetical protein
MSKFLPKYKAEKGHVKKGNPDLTNVLDGKLMYLKMVKGDADSVYVRLYNKFQELVAKDSSPEKKNSYGITHIETIPLVQFEQDNNTNVVFHHKEEGKRNATFEFDGLKQKANVSKAVTSSDELQKDKLVISNCRNPNGEQFWLIHLIDKVTVYKPTPVDINELNNELDSLLGT